MLLNNQWSEPPALLKLISCFWFQKQGQKGMKANLELRL